MASCNTAGQLQHRYTFGFKNFGVLTGLILLLVGLFGLVGIPIQAAQTDYWNGVDVAQVTGQRFPLAVRLRLPRRLASVQGW